MQTHSEHRQVMRPHTMRKRSGAQYAQAGGAAHIKGGGLPPEMPLKVTFSSRRKEAATIKNMPAAAGTTEPPGRFDYGRAAVVAKARIIPSGGMLGSGLSDRLPCC